MIPDPPSTTPNATSSPSRKRKRSPSPTATGTSSTTAVPNSSSSGDHTLLISNFARTNSRKRIRTDFLAPLLPSLPPLVRFRKIANSKKLFLDFESIEKCREAEQVLERLRPEWQTKVLRKHKKRKIVREKRDGANGPDRIEDSVTPLAGLGYDIQLKRKVRQIRRRIGRMVARVGFRQRKESDVLRELPAAAAAVEPTATVASTPIVPKIRPIVWVRGVGSFTHEGILPSPLIDGYRNNSEFSIGKGTVRLPTGDTVMEVRVGMLVGAFRDGFREVARVDNCRHVTTTSKIIARRMEEVVKRSGVAPYDRATGGGFWRSMKVRETVNKDVLVMVTVKPSLQLGDAWKEVLVSGLLGRVGLDEEDEEVGAVEPDVPPFALKGIQVLYHDGVSNAPPDDARIETVWGEEIIVEEVLGLKFAVSSKSFFQVNTKGAEVLYSVVRDWLPRRVSEEAEEEEEEEGELGSPQKRKILLLDLCCGTGTIGQILSPFADKVVGIDISESSVLDARANAERNGITNVSYICSPAETAIRDLLYREGPNYDEIVAVVDPPRAGLHRKVVTALRACKSIRHLIYVSCNVQSLCENVENLVKRPTNTYRGMPFVPVKAVAVDMFPHCDHCENVMLLERI